MSTCSPECRLGPVENPRPLVCVRCGAPRIIAAECPQCGVIYARVESRAARAAAPVPDAPVEAPAAAPVAWDEEDADTFHEWRLRLLAVPAALLVMWLVVDSGLGRMLLRIFLSMWVHELGHTVTAWFCGYHATPGPWFTSQSEQRTLLNPLVLAAGLGFMTWRGWQARRWGQVGAGVLLLGLQAVGTLVLKPWQAQMFITFGGDGGRFVLGSLLMASFYVPAEHPLRTRQLRWGFLVIGAAAWMDGFKTWWTARKDEDAIPFGLIEGIGTSDPTRLVEDYNWSIDQLVQRHVGLALVSLAALGCLYVVSLVRDRPRVFPPP